VSRYTREQAIEDGVLADVKEQAKETGILLSTVMEEIRAESAGQDYRGHLHDVLWMTFLKLKGFGNRAKSAEVFPAEMSIIIDRTTRKLWIVIDGDGLTIMSPEDY
jgi:hypothetical protein